MDVAGVVEEEEAGAGQRVARGARDTSATRMWLCGERTSVTSWRTCALSVHVIGSILVNMCHVR